MAAPNSFCGGSIAGLQIAAATPVSPDLLGALRENVDKYQKRGQLGAAEDEALKILNEADADQQFGQSPKKNAPMARKTPGQTDLGMGMTNQGIPLRE